MSSSKKISIGKLVRIVGGGTPSTKVSEYFDGDIPWVTPKDMKQWEINDSIDHISLDAVKNSAAKMIPPNAVLVVLRSGVLKHTLPVAINTRPVTLNQDMKALICGDDVHPAYLARFLKAQEQVLLGKIRGTTADNLPLDSLKSLEIPLPSIAQQRRIAAILDRADAVRRKRQEAIALTEELLRSAFLEMFGDPVTNPKGWEITTLETTFSRNPQIGTTKPAHADGEQIVVRVGEIGGQNVELNKCGRVTLEEKELERFLCKPGDLLLARAIGSESHLGKASILQSTEQVVVFDSHVMRLRFNTDLLLPIFFLQWLKTDGGRTRFMREAGRTAVQFNVNATQISRVEIPLPPIQLQKKFVSFYTKTLRSIENYGSGCKACNNLFNSLLQRAFQGKL